MNQSVPQTIQIRPAAFSDCAEAALLLVDQLAEHGVVATADRLVKVLERVVSDARSGFLLIAREGERMAGVAYAAAFLSAEHCGMAASLEELYVIPECRGRGVGTGLLRAVSERAAAAGMLAIVLEVDVGHSRVVPLYERFGFRRMERSRWVKKVGESYAIA